MHHGRRGAVGHLQVQGCCDGQEDKTKKGAAASFSAVFKERKVPAAGKKGTGKRVSFMAMVGGAESGDDCGSASLKKTRIE